jgi:hypothetical protein
MLITDFSSDIIIYISSYLYIYNLGNFILHDKSIYENKYNILKHNKDLNKYLAFDNQTSYYHIVFDNTILNISDLLLHNTQYSLNTKQIYALTNMLSYYVINNVITNQNAKTYLLSVFTNSKNKKNRRVKFCLKLFKVVFNENWEYFNINLYDLYNIICYVVYRDYDKLYDILYNIKIHKSLLPLDTIHILIKCNDDIHKLNIKMNDDMYLYKCVICYIMYNYIEHIHEYIIQTKLKNLIPTIIEKCFVITKLINDNKKITNNLKIMFLEKIDTVYNIFIKEEYLTT